MERLFDLAMPWWEFALRGAVSYLGLLVLMRLAGRHAFGEMFPFDIVVLVVVGGLLRSAILGGDESLLGPFIAIAAILGLDMAMAHLAARSRLLAWFLEGRAILLARAGKLIPGRLRRHGVSRAAFDRELRCRGMRSVGEAGDVYLEANGKLSFLKEEDEPR